jgi:serine phosphatase RsbU (regulator of sigma subunit)
MKVRSAANTLKQGVLAQLGRAGAKAVAEGTFDDTIRGVVGDLYRELQPRQILTEMGRAQTAGRASQVDRVANAALTTQAFGRRFELSEEELFVLAKSALLYGLKDLSGGDHCAFTRLDSRRVGLLIFDVSGHDEETSRMRDRLVDYLPQVSDPADPSCFAESLNQFLLDGDFPDDRFVSLLYGVIDLEVDLFRYANAGHNPPYIVRNRDIIQVKQGDLLLNVAPCPYKTYEMPIQREDCLVLYTDGLTEARKKAQNELFGADRLEEALRAHNLGGMRANRAVNTILRAVAEQGFDVEDDITVQAYRHL